MSFRREPKVLRWIAGNTVPSKMMSLEGVTTKHAAMHKRAYVEFIARSAVHPAMDEEIV